MQLLFLCKAEDKPATFLTKCREVHRREKTKHGSKRTKKKLAATSSKWATVMKILFRLLQQAFKTRWGKQSGFPKTGSVLDKPYWFKGDSKRVCVSLCVQSTVCYLLRSSSSWSWYSVNSLWNRRFSPMTGKTSRSRSRFRRPWKQTRKFDLFK